ncbi:MAG: type II toxin-antitoxin system PemK/MazF family toxin [Ignavibacteriales bacterium]|nr:type II toxin-antitoxin system PemK/MazF family toxin [Ignavibacteriales bacterium]
MTVQRGEIYMVDLNPTKGAELQKERPALIIQNDTGNRFSPVTIIAPISSMKEITKPIPVMVFVKAGEGGLMEDSYVDCGQIRTVDKAGRLGRRFGQLGGTRMAQVNKAILISLGI